MRVAVLGSWREKDAAKWDLRGTLGVFQQACRKIGCELIKQGHSLILGSKAETTADGNALVPVWSPIPAKTRHSQLPPDRGDMGSELESFLSVTERRAKRRPI